MQAFSFSDIATILKVSPLQQKSNPVIESLLTDSRKLAFPATTLFFAISSSLKNANDFIAGLYNQDVRCFVTDSIPEKAELQELQEANFIIVDDVTDALQKIASQQRHLFHYPVIGITGSNGKTIIKEWLYQLLNEKYNIIRNPGSYNSQVGVPLSVWQMNEMHTLGIFEAGISQPGEMVKLQTIIDPDIGVISFIGDAHAAGFENMEQKINEKLRLFTQSRKLIFCSDNEKIGDAISKFKKTINPDVSLFTWSKKKPADLFVKNIEKKDESTLISCRYLDNDFNFFIPFTDDASINNAITCCAVLLSMKETLTSIPVKMNELRAVAMRLELKQGNNNCSIINDSYSADINSLGVALDFLSRQQQHNKRTVILSDVLQSGQPSDILYARIAAILLQKQLYRFIGIGPGISAHANAFDKIGNTTFFPGTEEFLQQFHASQFNEETILLKGARFFRFEKISHALEQKIHETVLEINLNALRNNLKIYRQQLQKNVKMMAMVKAFSYGSGSYEIAGLLEHAGVDYLAVAYADEGVELRKAGIRLPVMVMNTSEAGFESLVRYKLEPELYSFRILYAFRHYLQQQSITHYPVHLKLDTGMHRLGFVPADIDLLCNTVSLLNEFKIRSVFSHLVASDDKVHDEFTLQQAALFLKMVTQIEVATGYPLLKHIANTSAIHRHPGLQLNMVRLGIGLYGVDDKQHLQNVTTLKTTISQIKNIKKGDTVGYSRNGIVHRDSSIATVRIGYADGYARLLGNGAGHMLVNGQLAPVIGNISMDMTMIDITGIAADEGDEVIVFGEELPVSLVAKWAQTIPYEILTNVSQRVKRVYYEE